MTESDKRLRDLQDRIAAQKVEAGIDQPTPPTASANEAANLRMGVKAGSEFVGSLLGGGILGWLADMALTPPPSGLIGGLIVGVIIAFWNLYKLTLPSASKSLPSADKADKSTID
jgi:ATP synthase protein I